MRPNFMSILMTYYDFKIQNFQSDIRCFQQLQGPWWGAFSRHCEILRSPVDSSSDPGWGGHMVLGSPRSWPLATGLITGQQVPSSHQIFLQQNNFSFVNILPFVLTSIIHHQCSLHGPDKTTTQCNTSSYICVRKHEFLLLSLISNNSYTLHYIRECGRQQQWCCLLFIFMARCWWWGRV